jgi:dTDP-4-amino-4,6-dideoxy-D-glucose ammonia-lyase
MQELRPSLQIDDPPDSIHAPLDLERLCGPSLRGGLDAAGSPGLAIWGAGRWGRVLAGAYLRAFPAAAPIHLVAERNHAEAGAWLARQPFSARVHLHAASQAVLEDPKITDVIISKISAEHQAAAQAALRARKHVYVEKPLPRRGGDLEALLRLAAPHDLFLCYGLEFYLAAGVHGLARVARQRRFVPTGVRVLWHDTLGHEQHGAPKTIDHSASVVADLLPHVLSMLEVVLGRGAVADVDAGTSDGCDHAELRFAYGGVPISVDLHRSAGRRERRLELGGKAGTLALDFTSEPGTVHHDGRDVTDPTWAERTASGRSVELLLAAFSSRRRDVPWAGDPLRHLVAAMERALDAFDRARLVRVAARPEAHPAAFREGLAHGLLQSGLIARVADTAELDRWTGGAARVVAAYMRDPFVSHRALAGELGVEAVTFERLSAALRGSPLAQSLMLEHGESRKYWQNTLLPLVRDGLVERVLAGIPSYPLRVGVYAGVSCMFHCTFCGRVPSAKYPAATIDSGTRLLLDMIRRAPTDVRERFYFSGGLEPLTNPRLGELVAEVADRGFLPSLYTNGFMLTEPLVERQPGLWQLDALRVSLYGVDERSYLQTTQRAAAFARVTDNLRRFLELRNRRGAGPRVGVNFVVQTGRTAEVDRLLDFVAELPGLDFLTLREDYARPPGQGLRAPERSRLHELFERMDRRLAQPGLRHLKVDLGYALAAIKAGNFDAELRTVRDEELRPFGHPQASVVVDLHGDVFLYREAGFIDRPGADRYIIGRLSDEAPLETIVARFLARPEGIPPRPGDTAFLDAYDHVVSSLMRQAEDDAAFGVPFSKGPIAARGPARCASAFADWNP